jgi:hypothetical protein
MRLAGHLTPIWEKRNPYGKRPLGILRLRWVYNIRMDLGGVGWDDVD